jgi:hypothetical protein
MTPKLKKIIIVLIILVILFVIYAVFVKSNPQIDPLLKGSGTQSDSVSTEEAQALGSQISQALLRIEKIRLDKAIFSDQIYRTLIDRSRPIEDEPMGRKNPFAPIGDISSDTTIRSTSTTRSIPATSTSATTSQQI